MAQGFANFISRLMGSSEMEGVNINLALPDASPIPATSFILRLDGVYFYKFSIRNLLNYFIITKRSFQLSPNDMAFFGFGFGLSKIFNRWLNRFVISKSKQASGLVFQSMLSKKMYERFVGPVTKPYAVIANGVDLTIFKPERTLDLPVDAIHLCVTANFRPHKRLTGAVSIANEFARLYRKPVRLHVAGNIDQVTKDHLSQHDTRSVVFHGELGESSLIDLYNSCHVGLAPAIFDPCPNAVIEMMACGLPVITCSNSGAAELVGCSDLIVEEDLVLKYVEFQTPKGLPVCELPKWIEKLSWAVDRNKECRFAVRKRCGELYDIEIIARQYKEFYESVIPE